MQYGVGRPVGESVSFPLGCRLAAQSKPLSVRHYHGRIETPTSPMREVPVRGSDMPVLRMLP